MLLKLERIFWVNKIFLGMNQEKMNRTIAEIAKDYSIRKEMIPVPTPITVTRANITNRLVSQGTKIQGNTGL